MANPVAHEVTAAYREAVVPGYETDPSAVGRNREAVDPGGDKDWTEVHGLTNAEVDNLTVEAI